MTAQAKKKEKRRSLFNYCLTFLAVSFSTLFIMELAGWDLERFISWKESFFKTLFIDLPIYLLIIRKEIQ